MEPIIAYCGLICTDCPGYLATQVNDLATLEKLATQAREEFNVPNATVASVLCDGCLSEQGHKCSYCAECAIRACGVARNLANCASCPDYACEKLVGFFDMVPEARTTLDRLRTAW